LHLVGRTSGAGWLWAALALDVAMAVAERLEVWLVLRRPLPTSAARPSPLECAPRCRAAM
jgi:hypothetical protein